MNLLPTPRSIDAITVFLIDCTQTFAPLARDILTTYETIDILMMRVLALFGNSKSSFNSLFDVLRSPPYRQETRYISARIGFCGTIRRPWHATLQRPL